MEEHVRELQESPPSARVGSAVNMISHENTNFGSIKINIGPGDYEWFSTPDSYRRDIQALCEKSDIGPRMVSGGLHWMTFNEVATIGLVVV
ncbi:AAEL000480-PA [Aedes aegypti]|uniref:AAEL000480-PA n=1 Tax=Aedes aegypti TaxID=7159 RepID=Q17P52_AEDAE|nr:AAEL000480-PA [Aedes aegypti]